MLRVISVGRNATAIARREKKMFGHELQPGFRGPPGSARAMNNLLKRFECGKSQQRNIEVVNIEHQAGEEAEDDPLAMACAYRECFANTTTNAATTNTDCACE